MSRLAWGLPATPSPGPRLGSHACAGRTSLGASGPRARAAAGLAELWYCQASAKSLRLRDHESFEAVQSLARRSIAKTHEALTEIRELGLGQTRLAVTICVEINQ